MERQGGTANSEPELLRKHHNHATVSLSNFEVGIMTTPSLVVAVQPEAPAHEQERSYDKQGRVLPATRQLKLEMHQAFGLAFGAYDHVRVGFSHLLLCVDCPFLPLHGRKHGWCDAVRLKVATCSNSCARFSASYPHGRTSLVAWVQPASSNRHQDFKGRSH